MSMRTLYKRFKEMTGKSGADLAETHNVTRQYISLLVNTPNPNNDRRLGQMMEREILISVGKLEQEIKELLRLQEEIAYKRESGVSA